MEESIDPIIDQNRKPRRGDVLRAIVNGYWMIINLTSNEHKIWKAYYNFRLEDGSEDGMYLRQGEHYWTFQLDDAEDLNDEVDLERQDDTEVVDNSRMITPDTSDDDRNTTFVEPEAQEYLDDEYSDQDSIFGNSHMEYFTNSFNSAIQEARHEAFATSTQRTLDEDEGRAFGLVQRLNLELPQSGKLAHNRVYKIPPGWRSTDHITRSRIVSASSIGLNEEPPDQDPIQPSAWQRRKNRFQKFVLRIGLAFHNPFARRR